MLDIENNHREVRPACSKTILEMKSTPDKVYLLSLLECDRTPKVNLSRLAALPSDVNRVARLAGAVYEIDCDGTFRFINQGKVIRMEYSSGPTEEPLYLDIDAGEFQQLVEAVNKDFLRQQ